MNLTWPYFKSFQDLLYNLSQLTVRLFYRLELRSKVKYLQLNEKRAQNSHVYLTRFLNQANPLIFRHIFLISISKLGSKNIKQYGLGVVSVRIKFFISIFQFLDLSAPFPQMFWMFFRIFSRYYKRNNSHSLCNVPYVDNSYKWSGGGFLSNVDDLMKFGEFMRKSFRSDKGMNLLF